MAWSPAEARAKHGLTLSAEERARVDANMAPLARGADGLYPADAVFEGGGVLGTAFLGAARCCADVGLRWNGLAGTSAGAVTAALLAADLGVDRLEAELGGLDYARFLAQKTSRLIRNGDPSDDLDNPFRLLANLVVAGQEGQYSTAPFRAWLAALLAAAGRTTFGDVRAKAPAPAERQLKVVVSDLTRGLMRVLPDDLTAEAPPPVENFAGLAPDQAAYPVADAVTLSMSIPLFFEPGRLGDSVVVDGGILSNFPLWIFDEVDVAKPPAWPTFGFRLMAGAAGPRAVAGATGILAAMLKTMMVASDRHYVARKGRGRVVDIDLAGLPVTATQFALADEFKEELYVRGYRAAKDFFLTKWSWDRHLRERMRTPAGDPTPVA